jgi:hypothetical protein
LRKNAYIIKFLNIGQTNMIFIGNYILASQKKRNGILNVLVLIGLEENQILSSFEV